MWNPGINQDENREYKIYIGLNKRHLNKPDPTHDLWMKGKLGVNQE